MSTKDIHRPRTPQADADQPSNRVHLPGTVGATQPERAIALLRKWVEEGDAEEDRQAYEALREEIERARA